ncbi:MAG: hypothetical protein QOG71_3901 [Pyrinomonadaceae bacterium]|nr:hypothetical protein [Pyrinomonadaceae bacterium]
MKILMVATCVLMLCFSSSHAWAQNCKPDVSQVDKISKQQQDYWLQTLSTSEVAITISLRNGATSSSISVQIDKQEAAATSNTQFQSPLHAEKGNQFYFGLKNGEPLAFVATSVSNNAKVSGSFMAGLSGKNLYTSVVLVADVQDKDLATLREALTRKPIDAVRILLADNVRIDKPVDDKTGNKMMEKFLCFYQSLDEKGIDLSAVGPPPVPPSDASISGKYIRKDKTSDYIELKPDGTFSLQLNGRGYTGNYGVQANALTIHISSRRASTARLSGNAVTFSDGNAYEKEAEQQKTATQLTIDQIIQMVAAKLPDDIIITTIRKSGSKFDLNPDALIKLKTAGVSDAVLRAMSQ